MLSLLTLLRTGIAPTRLPMSPSALRLLACCCTAFAALWLQLLLLCCCFPVPAAAWVQTNSSSQALVDRYERQKTDGKDQKRIRNCNFTFGRRDGLAAMLLHMLVVLVSDRCLLLFPPHTCMHKQQTYQLPFLRHLPYNSTRNLVETKTTQNSCHLLACDNAMKPTLLASMVPFLPELSVRGEAAPK